MSMERPVGRRGRPKRWLEWPYSRDAVPWVGSGQWHARTVWDQAAWLTQGLPVGRRTVDGDLEFLKQVARHIQGCRMCRTRYRDGRPEDWLWKAVRTHRSLRELVDVLEGGSMGA